MGAQLEAKLGGFGRLRLWGLGPLVYGLSFAVLKRFKSLSGLSGVQGFIRGLGLGGLEVSIGGLGLRGLRVHAASSFRGLGSGLRR